VKYGAQVLSHPLIVSAIEEHFIPVCIYNNTKGDDDARVLKEFKERSWNNPVVRIIDRNRADLTPRIHDKWTVKALCDSIVSVIVKKKKKLPPYLKILIDEEEARSRGVKEAIFSMG